MYEIVVESVNGNRAFAGGVEYIIAGSAPVMAGKRCFTDGKIIYGNVVPSGDNPYIPVPMGIYYINHQGELFVLKGSFASKILPSNYDNYDNLIGSEKRYFAMLDNDGYYNKSNVLVADKFILDASYVEENGELEVFSVYANPQNNLAKYYYGSCLNNTGFPCLYAQKLGHDNNNNYGTAYPQGYVSNDVTLGIQINGKDKGSIKLSAEDTFTFLSNKTQAILNQAAHLADAYFLESASLTNNFKLYRNYAYIQNCNVTNDAHVQMVVKAYGGSKMSYTAVKSEKIKDFYFCGNTFFEKYGDLFGEDYTHGWSLRIDDVSAFTDAFDEYCEAVKNYEEDNGEEPAMPRGSSFTIHEKKYLDSEDYTEARICSGFLIETLNPATHRYWVLPIVNNKQEEGYGTGELTTTDTWSGKSYGGNDVSGGCTAYYFIEYDSDGNKIQNELIGYYASGSNGLEQVADRSVSDYKAGGTVTMNINGFDVKYDYSQLQLSLFQATVKLGDVKFEAPTNSVINSIAYFKGHYYIVMTSYFIDASKSSINNEDYKCFFVAVVDKSGNVTYPDELKENTYYYARQKKYETNYISYLTFGDAACLAEMNVSNNDLLLKWSTPSTFKLSQSYK